MDQSFVNALPQENMELLAIKNAQLHQKLKSNMIKPDVFVKELQLVENFWHQTLPAPNAMLDSILQNHAIKNALV